MSTVTGPGAATRRRPLQVVGGVFLVVLTLIVGKAILTTERTNAENHAAFVHTGHVGDIVDGWKFSAQVVQIRGSPLAVTTSYDRDSGDTDGVFIVVTVVITAYREHVELGLFTSHDDAGNEYLPTSRVKQDHPVQFEAGTPTQFDLVYEVPRAVAPTLTVRISMPNIETRMATFAEIQLDITPDQVESWLRNPKPIEPNKTAVVSS